MSQNRTTGNNPGRSSTGAGTGATDAGTTTDTSSLNQGNASAPTTLSSGGTGGQGITEQAQGLATQAREQAQEYGQRIATAATQAKDYVSDKVTVVGDRIKDLQNKDINQVAEDAKAYARQNPGQALLISAAAGFLLGLILRGSRR